MTDRFHSLTVVLDQNIREDDAESLINAISMIKGVLSVSGNASDLSEHVARQRLVIDLRQRLWTLADEIEAGDRK